MIEKKEIKSVGLEIPSLTFGGASIGNLFNRMTNVEAMEVVEEAIKVGWRSFDTAPHYGSSLSELRLGLGLRGLENDEYILSTKVGRMLVPRHEEGLEEGDFFFDENPFNREFDYTYDGIMRSYEDSLKRLGKNKIDILYIHDVGTYTHGNTPEERKHFKDLCDSGYKALEELKEKGEIKAFGIGANEKEIIMEAMDHFDMDVVMFANRYNLLETNHDDFFDKCEKNNVSVIVAAPFATGILATGNTDGRYEYGKLPEHLVTRVEKIKEICARYNVPIGAAAIQFPLRNKNVVSVNSGVRTIKQANTNYEWMNTNIPEEMWKELEALDK